MQTRLFLASRSPRRRALLQQLGLDFDVLDIDVPEQRAPGESAEAYVRRVAGAKAAAGWRAVASVAGAVVIGADTEVVLDDDVFGKPADAGEAAAMLRRLGGRSHHVLSALCCVDAQHRECMLCTTTVEFAELDEGDIAAYVATGEGFGKAGAYAIQGRAAAFIRRLEGSYSAVVGLPLHETAQLLRGFAVATRSSG